MPNHWSPGILPQVRYRSESEWPEIEGLGSHGTTPNKHQLDLDSLTNTVNIQSTGLEKVKQARVESPDSKIRIIPDKESHAV